MASSDYYNEHNCEPLADGSGPNHLLHLARYAFFYPLPDEVGQGIMVAWDVQHVVRLSVFRFRSRWISLILHRHIP